MKKSYALILLILFVLSFYACKKDNSEKNSPAPITKTIIGVWRTDYRNFEFSASGKVIDTYTTNYTGDDMNQIIFNEDGTGSIKVKGEVTTKFEYTVSDTEIAFTKASSFYNNKQYAISDFKYTILKSNATELYYLTGGSVGSPSQYDHYKARVHLIR